MGPDLTSAPRATACPSCGASVRTDAAFCGQCYADFRPPPEPAPAPPAPTVPAPTALYGVPAGDPLTAPLLDFLPEVPTAAPAAVEAAAPAVPASTAGEPTWPCAHCQAANPIAAMTCGSCFTPFLADVAGAGRPVLVLPLVGDLGRLSRGQRYGVALGAVALVLAPLALVTLLLTGSPPAQQQGGTSTTTVTSSP